MSSLTTDQLSATGTAQVIAILEAAPPAPAGKAAGALSLAATTSSHLAGLDSYFVTQEGQNHELAMAGMSNVAALAKSGITALAGTRTPQRAPNVLYFPNLGVMLGTVTKEGLQGLKADPRVKQVV